MNLKSDAKVQRFLAQNKKSQKFFIHLLRQQMEFATEHETGLFECRKRHEINSYFRVQVWVS